MENWNLQGWTSIVIRLFFFSFEYDFTLTNSNNNLSTYWIPEKLSSIKVVQLNWMLLNFRDRSELCERYTQSYFVYAIYSTVQPLIRVIKKKL